MFYYNFVNLCNEKGISPSAAAEAMNMQRSVVTHWKNGRTPHQATLQKVAKFFGVAVEDLLADNEIPAIEHGGAENDLIELIDLWKQATPERRKLALDLLRLS